MYARKSHHFRSSLRQAPSKYVLKLLSELKDCLKPYASLVTDKHLLLLQTKVYDHIKAVLDNEENQRPSLQIDVAVLDKQNKLKLEIEFKNGLFEKQFIEHEKKQSELNNELAILYDKIQQAQGEAMVSSLRQMVDFQLLHHKIQDEANTIDQAIERMGSFARLFSCNTRVISEKKTSLAQLRAERDALSSSNPEQFRLALTSHLSKRRDEVSQALQDLADHQPEKNTDQLIQDLAESEAEIEHRWNKHYYILSHTAMLQCVRVYALLREVANGRVDDGLPDFTQRRAIKKILKKLSHELHKTLQGFFCEEQKSDEPIFFDAYYARYKLLKPESRKQLLVSNYASKTILQHLFPKIELSASAVRKMH